MSYLHEQQLKEAQKKLYMLGSSDRPHLKTSFEGAGASLGGMIGSAQAQQAAQKLRAKQATEARQKEALGVRDALVDGNESWQAHNEMYGDHASPEVGQNMMASFTHGQRMPIDQDGQVEAWDPAYDPKSVQDRINSNEAAAETRMGGKYTVQGLETASRNADANANDLLRARSLIGIGGTRSF